MWFGLIGGLAMFIYGMIMLGDGLQSAAGDRLRRILELLTRNAFIGVLLGTFVTILTQSSSATTVMVVGFVNAGLMNLSQAIGVIMGANIGTTFTAQLIAFKFEDLALPILAVGVVVFLIAKKRRTKAIGQTLIGFGILFLGMKIMGTSVAPLKDKPIFNSWMAKLGTNPLYGVLLGTVFTGIIQSSGASIGLIQTLAGQGAVKFSVALPFLFGANIGTTATAQLASIGTGLNARRTAMMHTLFNVIGTVIFLPFIIPYGALIEKTSPNIVRQIANAHTGFNVLNTLIMLPLAGLLVKAVTKIIPGEEKVISSKPQFLDDRLLDTPAVAILQGQRELQRMGELALANLDDSLEAFTLGKTDEVFKSMNAREEAINQLEEAINHYAAKIAQGTLDETQSAELTALLSNVKDVERIGDQVDNIRELVEYMRDNNLPFSDTAHQELKAMFDYVRENVEMALKALHNNDKATAKVVLEHENNVDVMERDFRLRHIRRLNEGNCYPGSGVVYLDVLSNLERISDHAENIAESVLGIYGENNGKAVSE